MSGLSPERIQTIRKVLFIIEGGVGDLGRLIGEGELDADEVRIRMGLIDELKKAVRDVARSLDPEDPDKVDPVG